MKKSLIQSLALALMVITLTACGGNQATNPAPVDDNPPIRFKIGQNTWQVKLVLDWSQSQTHVPGTIFVAQSQDQNFIIAQKPRYDAKTLEKIKAKAAETFFDFQLIKEGANTLVFDGKLGIEDPIRRFHEKILPVVGTESYLIGVCSYDYWEGRSEVCTQTLNQWVAENTE